MKCSMYLNVVNCSEAIKFYEGVFNIEIKNIMRNPENNEQVLYSDMIIGNMELHLSDINTELVKGNNWSITVDVESDEKVKKIYDLLSADGVVNMEYQETFFASSYCFITDKYNINWQILNQKPMM